MDKYWDKIRQEKYDGSFERTTKALLRNQTLKPERKYKMKSFFIEHRFKIAVAIFLALIVGACNYPVTQEKSVGYAFSWTAKAENEKTVSQSLKNLNWLKNASMNISVKNVSGSEIAEFNTILQNIDEKTAMLYKNDLEKIKEINSVKILPLTESVTVPIYSAALYRFFRVEISSSGKSEAEVKAEIEKQLKENGFENSTVTYEKVGDHNRLMIKLPENADLKGQNMEVRVGGDGKEEVIKMKSTKGSGIDKNMTDDEIKRKIIADNGGDLKPEDIKIIRDGDKIKVEVEKEN